MPDSDIEVNQGPDLYATTGKVCVRANHQLNPIAPHSYNQVRPVTVNNGMAIITGPLVRVLGTLFVAYAV